MSDDGTDPEGEGVLVEYRGGVMFGFSGVTLAPDLGIEADLTLDEEELSGDAGEEESSEQQPK